MNETNFEQILKESLPALDRSKIDQLSHYLKMMLKWNQTYNLTAITDPKEMVIKHILDSLSILPYLEGEKILDVGSGAGLPGIPLAILCPDKHFTLLDKNGKKCRFLTQAKLELCLENTEILTGKAETLQGTGQFDIVLARALSAASAVLRMAQHLCAPDGQFLLMKGEYPKDELNEIDKTFKIAWVKSLEIAGLNAQRHLVCIKFANQGN